MDKQAIMDRVNEVRATMGTAGWEILRNDIQKQYDDLKEGAVRNITDERTLYYAKGYHDGLHLFLNYEKVLDSVEAGLNGGDDDAPAV